MGSAAPRWLTLFLAPSLCTVRSSWQGWILGGGNPAGKTPLFCDLECSKWMGCVISGDSRTPGAVPCVPCCTKQD